MEFDFCSLMNLQESWVGRIGLLVRRGVITTKLRPVYQDIEIESETQLFHDKRTLRGEGFVFFLFRARGKIYLHDLLSRIHMLLTTGTLRTCAFAEKAGR